MKTKVIILLLVTLCIALLACSCDTKTVTRSYVDDQNRIVLVYSDGTEEILQDSIVTVTGTSVNEEKHLIVTYSDGTEEDMGYVGVVDESLNVKIKNTKIDENLHLIVE